MKKKWLIIFVIFVLAILAFGLLFGNKNTNTGAGDGKINTGFSDIFTSFGDRIFGDRDSQTGTGTGEDDGNTTTEVEQEMSRVKKVSNESVAGFTYYNKTFKVNTTEEGAPAQEGDETTDTEKVVATLRYMERSTGHIYDYGLNEKEEFYTKYISNTTIPKIQEALFFNKGLSVVARMLSDDNETIRTFVGDVLENGDDDAGKTAGNFAEDDMLEVAVNSNENSYYFVRRVGGETFVYKRDRSLNKTTSLLGSSFSSWLIRHNQTDSLTLSTKATYHAQSFIYKLKDDGSMTKIHGDEYGSTGMLSGDGKWLLYSKRSGSSFSLHLLNTEDMSISDTGLKTLVDKCVWTEDSSSIYCGVPNSIIAGTYPDDWYLGNRSFADSIWKLNVNNLSSFKVSDVSKEAKEDIDVYSIAVSLDESRIAVLNKSTGYLYEISN